MYNTAAGDCTSLSVYDRFKDLKLDAMWVTAMRDGSHILRS